MPKKTNFVFCVILYHREKRSDGNCAVLHKVKIKLYIKNMFVPTAEEIKLLSFLKTQSEKSSLETIAKKNIASKTAVEGCVAKGFAKEENGALAITADGEKQI